MATFGFCLEVGTEFLVQSGEWWTHLPIAQYWRKVGSFFFRLLMKISSARKCAWMEVVVCSSILFFWMPIWIFHWNSVGNVRLQFFISSPTPEWTFLVKISSARWCAWMVFDIMPLWMSIAMEVGLCSCFEFFEKPIWVFEGNSVRNAKSFNFLHHLPTPEYMFQDGNTRVHHLQYSALWRKL